MKILIMNESFPPIYDGVSILVKSYAECMSRAGERVTVALPHIRNLSVNGYPYRIVRFFSLYINKKIGYPVGLPLFPLFYFRILKEKPDIIHVHSPFAAGLSARIIRFLTGAPIVLTYHTKFEEDFEKRLRTKLMRRVSVWFIRCNIEAADEVWTVSRGAAGSLRYIGCKCDYHVHENGTDFTFGKAPQELVSGIINKHGINKENPVFLFVGRMMWYKNIKLSLDALRILKEKGEEFTFVVVGKGNDAEEIHDYAHENGLLDNTVFVGEVQDRETLRAYYTIADLFLFPSKFDTSGLVIREAAAAGCPGLVLKGECAAECIEDGVNGFVSEDGAEALSEKIMQAMSDRVRLSEVGDNAGRQVYKSFETAAGEAVRRYSDIIKKKRKRK